MRDACFMLLFMLIIRVGTCLNDFSLEEGHDCHENWLWGWMVRMMEVGD